MTGLVESIEKALVKQYRKRISRRLYEASDGVVRRGPFAGMKLGGASHLSTGPMALKLFGLYETEVVELLAGQAGRSVLVNAGAGDGYFSVGMIRAGAVVRSVCFELDPKGREVIAASARLNGVEDRIVVHGAADASMPDVLAREGVESRSAIVLCDIEGAEFTVLDARLIAQMAGALFVVELHPHAVSGGDAAIAALEGRFSATHATSILKARPRDWSGIAELEALNDNARALATSEGRKELGIWLVAEPRV